MVTFFFSPAGQAGCSVSFQYNGYDFDTQNKQPYCKSHIAAPQTPSSRRAVVAYGIIYQVDIRTDFNLLLQTLPHCATSM